MAAMNTMNQAVALMGKEVTIIDPSDPSKTITGKVAEVRSNGKESYIVFEHDKDMAYSLVLVQTIREPGASSGNPVIPPAEDNDFISEG